MYILFSSGTTGVPKCITHGAGGTLLQHLKEYVLHTDVTRDDTLLFAESNTRFLLEVAPDDADALGLGEELDEVLARARQAGVRRITSIGCAHDLDSIDSALKIARVYPDWISACDSLSVLPFSAVQMRASSSACFSLFTTQRTIWL